MTTAIAEHQRALRTQLETARALLKSTLPCEDVALPVYLGFDRDNVMQQCRRQRRQLDSDLRSEVVQLTPEDVASAMREVLLNGDWGTIRPATRDREDGLFIGVDVQAFMEVAERRHNDPATLSRVQRAAKRMAIQLDKALGTRNSRIMREELADVLHAAGLGTAGLDVANSFESDEWADYRD